MLSGRYAFRAFDALESSQHSASLGIKAMSRCMMGVYLAHPLFAIIARRVFEPGSYAGAVLAYGLALGFVLLCLRLVPASAWAFGAKARGA